MVTGRRARRRRGAGRYGFRSVSTFQIEELVSHRYVVVGLDQPGAVATVRFPDGRQVPNLPFEQINPLSTRAWHPSPWCRCSAGCRPYGLLTGRLDLGHAG